MIDHIASPVRLADALHAGGVRGREVESALAIHIEPFMLANRLTVNDILRAMAGNIVAIVFAKATGLHDAQEGMRTICDAMMRRVTEH